MIGRVAALHPRQAGKPLRCCTRLPRRALAPAGAVLVAPDPAAVLRAGLRAACCASWPTIQPAILHHAAHVTAVGARAAHQVVEVATAIASLDGHHPFVALPDHPETIARRIEGKCASDHPFRWRRSRSGRINLIDVHRPGL